MKKILITGGSGFIGSALTKVLVKKGHHVRVFDNGSRGSLKRLENIQGKFEYVQGDIRDYKAVENSCEGVDTIIHLAYINGTKFFYSSPDLVLDVAVKGMINILEASKKNNIKNFFFASSSEVYNNPSIIPTPERISLIIPDPYNPRYSYSGGKMIGELMTIHNGNRIFEKSIIFRPHNVFGPDMGNEHVIPELFYKLKSLIKNNASLKIPIQGSGNETRSFIYIDDFTSGLLLLLNKGINNETYNIGTSDEINIKTLVKKMGEYFQKKATILPGIAVLGSPKRRCPDIQKIEKLGFRPKTPFSVGLYKTLQWYDQNK